MKENVIYFRKNGITKMGFIARKPQNNQIKKYSIKTNKETPYLRATSGAIIDTEYKCKSNNIKVELCFKGLSAQNSTLFGAESRQEGSTQTSGKYSLNGYMTSSTKLKYSWNIGKIENLGVSEEKDLNGKHKLIIETNELKSRVTCCIDSQIQEFINSNAVITNKLLTNSIFGIHLDDGSYTQFSPCDVYYCNIWDDGELVRNMYPVKSGDVYDSYIIPSDGMWDYVKREFHGNKTGNGTLTYYTE